jgi:hypothetical protein
MPARLAGAVAQLRPAQADVVTAQAGGRLLRAGVLRVLSIGTSVSLLTALARGLTVPAFAASQVAASAAGLALIATDLGLVLHTTRMAQQVDTDQVETVLGARLLVLALALMCTAPILLKAGGALLPLVAFVPYAFATLVRNHVFAQLRGTAGVDLELSIAPLANVVETAPCALVAIVFHNAIAAFLAMGLVGTINTVAILRAARCRDTETTVGVRVPRARLLTIGIQAWPLSLIGAAPKILLLTSASYLASLPMDAHANVVTAIRVVDSAFLFLTVASIMPAYRSVGRTGRAAIPPLLTPGIGLVVLSAIATPLISGRVPSALALVLTLGVGIMGGVWYAASAVGHVYHVLQLRPRWAEAILANGLALTLLIWPKGPTPALLGVAAVATSSLVITVWRSRRTLRQQPS